MQIDVCVATFRRPEGLRHLLEGLDKLAFEKVELPSIEITVVDNDSTGSASAHYEKLSSQLKWPLKYYIEPRRGISQARNKALECARQDVDFIAFIDDDEVPEPLWLDELLYVQQLFAADVVGGPVLPRFHEQVPDWAIKGRFFEKRPPYPTGHTITLAATNNSLVRAEILRGTDIHFDPRAGLTGGEDTRFFFQLHQAGYKMVWADKALVHEYVPESRTKVRWLLKKAYRTGTGLSQSDAVFHPSISRRVIRAIKGSGRIAQGLLLVVSSIALGMPALVKGLQFIGRGVGMLAGMVGARYEIYR